MSESSSGDRRGYARSNPRSGAALVGAFIAVFAVIAFIWALSWFQHRDPENPAKTVDYTAALAGARHQAPFDVLAPTPAPPDWRCTSVDYEGAGPEVSWHLGFLTGDGEYVGLEQGNAVPSDFVSAHTPANHSGAPVEVAGQTWSTLTSGDGEETALVRKQPGVTTVVTGTAPEAVLRDFAASLW